MSREGRLFIESSRFPVALVSAASAKEKQGGGRPPFWEMVFWWTRKPLASARAVIAGCLLPEDIDVDEFVKALWLDEKVAHRHNPIIPEKWRQYFSGKRLLDPFAGFGSIPLEAMRLGLNATAVELPPSCYIFLKAVLEYPQRYGEQLVKDVECWGKWITKSLKEDQVIKKLYDSDVAIYIGSWEVKCPHCGKWTPLIGNFWLARVKNKDKYTQLAWMKVVKNDKGELSIEVEDLSEKLESMEDIKVEGNKIKVADTVYTVPSANISPRSEQAMCLNCNGTIRYVDIETGKHYVDSSKAPNKQLLEWYVKYALKKFNSGEENYARLRLLVRVKAIERSLKFEPCTEKDQEKLEIARKEILKMLEANDLDIPREGISPYSVRYLFPILYGMTEWYKLFNPRQLLTLVKLVKLIREAGKQIEQEKIKEGLSKEEAFKYAEEVTTYLVIALCKHADYNSMMSGWQLSYLIAAHSLAMRGIAMIWNWGEYNPFSDYTGAISSMIKRNVVNGLSYLVSVLHNISNLLGKEQGERGVKVLFDDATVLTKLGSEEKFDLIVTDPPYYDDVPYTELSDFYYVWLKRALSDVRDNKLQPRFHADAFFKRMGSQVIEIRTQWEEFALREVSLNPPRLGENVKYEEGVDYFQKLLDASFISMRNLLKEKGVLVTYYAHTDPEAWKALLRSGWESAALSIVNVFPIATEFALSVVKRGKLSLDTSIVVVWKGFASGSIRASQLYEEMVKSSEERGKNSDGHRYWRKRFVHWNISWSTICCHEG
jgi:putative DNA methylase